MDTPGATNMKRKCLVCILPSTVAIFGEGSMTKFFIHRILSEKKTIKAIDCILFHAIFQPRIFFIPCFTKGPVKMITFVRMTDRSSWTLCHISQSNFISNVGMKIINWNTKPGIRLDVVRMQLLNELALSPVSSYWFILNIIFAFILFLLNRC